MGGLRRGLWGQYCAVLWDLETIEGLEFRDLFILMGRNGGDGGHEAARELWISGGWFRLRASYFSLIYVKEKVTKRKRTLVSAPR